MRKPDCITCQQTDYSDGHYPTCPCDEMSKYRAHLESRRKYRRGTPIESLDILADQEFAFMFGKVMYKGWFLSMQFRMLSNLIKRKRIYYAIRKEELNNG